MNVVDTFTFSQLLILIRTPHLNQHDQGVQPGHVTLINMIKVFNHDTSP